MSPRRRIRPAPTLRAQLMRASLLTTLAALVLSSVLILFYEFMSYRDERAADLGAQAELIAHTVAPALIFNDPATAEQQLASLWQHRQLRSAAVYDATGRRFAEFRALSPGGTAAARTPDTAPSAPGLRYQGPLLEVSQAVVHDGERVGMVYLLAAHDVAGRVAGYASILGVVMALSLGVALVVFGRLQRVVTRPLGDVTHVAQQVMEQRNWGLRAPRTDNRDIGVLVDAFNGMLGEVQARTEELEHEMGERRRAEAELREADRRKDVFLATLAHELRNPLAPMSSSLSLLRKSAAMTAAQEKSLGILERQLRHMVRLIDDLLDVSRISTGKLVLLREPVDLIGVLQQAVELIEPVASAKRLTLHVALPDLPCPLQGDGARLLQVFSNLLTNACRYTPEGGEVTVSTQISGHEALVSVRDTGVGVDPTMQRRIFELFEQVDKSLERGHAGLGIGLTLARQLVQLHGGDITLFSAGLGHGATFTVWLPLHPALQPVLSDTSAT